jgi:hypothetical protein
LSITISGPADPKRLTPPVRIVTSTGWGSISSVSVLAGWRVVVVVVGTAVIGVAGAEVVATAMVVESGSGAAEVFAVVVVEHAISVSSAATVTLLT